MSEANVASSRSLNMVLRMAVMAGVESAVQLHVDRGDDLNARDSNGMTPLMLSAARNKPAICKMLLDAGADDRVLDPSGKTALGIAIAAGATEAAAVLKAAQTLPLIPEDPVPSAASRTACAVTGSSPWSDTRPVPEALGPTAPIGGSMARAASTAIRTDEPSEFDLSGWEAEEDVPPLESDSSVLRAASAIQVAISAHKPTDSSAEWDDIEAYLPEQASPLPGVGDPQAQARLRLLLLRAIREGSVPSSHVEALSANVDRSADAEAEARLGMVINDLGAEIDERFEYTTATESWEVFVKPDETPDEQEALDEALAAIERGASPQNEPLRMYQREFQALRLLSAQEEVALGQAMEHALEAALDALAAWPQGVAWTLASGIKVKGGLRPLAWMSIGGAEPDIESPLADGPEAQAPTADGKEDAMDRDGDPPFEMPPQLGDAAFKEALSHLGALRVGTVPEGPAWRAVRDALAALRLNRRFLLELDEIEDAKASATGARYAEAMVAYRRARDRMTAANLKLAFHLAKKYLYSGEPLNDLAQEANIGLLKAVDRFDWRRGFRFSTYATWWIRQQLGRHIADKGRTIRLPVHIYDKLQRLQRETQAFESAFGRAPQLDEIAERMEMPADKLSALQRLIPEPLSIYDLPVDQLVAVEARDRFASPDPAEITCTNDLYMRIDEFLAMMGKKEEQIIRLRYGIGVRDSQTLEEIGQRFSLTRERIRQIESKALKRLEHAFARADIDI